MSSLDVFTEIQTRLRGQAITDRQLAGNTLSVWVAIPQGGGAGWSVWFEPSWHLAGPEGVLAGSRQAQDEDDPTGWQAVSDAVDVLVGRVVEDLRRDERTGDLELIVSGGVCVRTFVTDPRDDMLWHIKEHGTGRRLVGSKGGVAVEHAA